MERKVDDGEDWDWDWERRLGDREKQAQMMWSFQAGWAVVG